MKKPKQKPISAAVVIPGANHQPNQPTNRLNNQPNRQRLKVLKVTPVPPTKKPAATAAARNKATKSGITSKATNKPQNLQTALQTASRIQNPVRVQNHLPAVKAVLPIINPALTAVHVQNLVHRQKNPALKKINPASHRNSPPHRPNTSRPGLTAWSLRRKPPTTWPLSRKATA